MFNRIVAETVKKVAEVSARNAVGKKVIIMAYEPEIPEAVKKMAQNAEKD